jgi:hypothetical protein
MTDTSWAYNEGAAAGREGNKTRRGIMALGLGCAATSIDAANTEAWLKGFDDHFGKEPERKETTCDFECTR